ncbi:MAG TPA: hypothetical protein VKW09_10895 [bacterium]|nr:hypothetical protein [bacterium]
MRRDSLESIDRDLSELEGELHAVRAQLHRLLGRRTKYSSGVPVAVISALLALCFGSALAAAPRPRVAFAVLGASGQPVMEVHDVNGGWLGIASASPRKPNASPWVAGLSAAGGGGQIGVNDVNGTSFVTMYFPHGRKGGSLDIVHDSTALAQLGPGAENVMALRISNAANKKVGQFGEGAHGYGAFFIFSAEGRLAIQAAVTDNGVGIMDAIGPKGPVPLWFKGVLVGK